MTSREKRLCRCNQVMLYAVCFVLSVLVSRAATEAEFESFVGQFAEPESEETFHEPLVAPDADPDDESEATDDAFRVSFEEPLGEPRDENEATEDMFQPLMGEPEETDDALYSERTPFVPVHWDGCKYKDAERTADRGTISSPRFPINYPNQALCGWRIRVRSGEKIVLTFHDFQVEEDEECMTDAVEIYDGPSVRSPFLGSFCGKKIPDQIKSTRNSMYVVFYSDRSDTSKGFRASYVIESLANEPAPTPKPVLPTAAPGATCGKSSVHSLHTLIMGGEPAKRHSWPWQASLQFAGGHVCGATIISERFVLTAAHCVMRGSRVLSARFFRVIVGEHDRGAREATEKSHSVTLIIPRDGKKDSNYGNDIALLLVEPAIQFNQAVSAVCLTDIEFPAQTMCTTTGWGSTKGTGNNRILQEVAVPILSRETCSRRDYYGEDIKDDMLCAGYAEGGKDSCKGDSGGPLVCKSGNHWFLQGITSWGSNCGEAKKPGVYTRVTSHMEWIDAEKHKYSAEFSSYKVEPYASKTPAFSIPVTSQERLLYPWMVDFDANVTCLEEPEPVQDGISQKGEETFVNV